MGTILLEFGPPAPVAPRAECGPCSCSVSPRGAPSVWLGQGLVHVGQAEAEQWLGGARSCLPQHRPPSEPHQPLGAPLAWAQWLSGAGPWHSPVSHWLPGVLSGSEGGGPGPKSRLLATVPQRPVAGLCTRVLLSAQQGSLGPSSDHLLPGGSCGGSSPPRPPLDGDTAPATGVCKATPTSPQAPPCS